MTVLLGRGDTAVSDQREECDTLPTPSPSTWFWHLGLCAALPAVRIEAGKGSSGVSVF